MDDQIISHILAGGGGVGTALAFLFFSLRQIRGELAAVARSLAEARNDLKALREDGMERERKNAEDHKNMIAEIARMQGRSEAG